MTSPRSRRIKLWILLCAAVVFGAAADALTGSATDGGLPAQEAARIEALIDAVQRLVDAAFIRNGQAYDSAAAAEFLRRKWQVWTTHIASAEDFIEKVASVSSTSGRPYVIRLGDGREILCSVFLRDTLNTIQLKGP